MTPSQYICLLERHVQKHYSSDRDAAKAFKCSPSTMSLVLSGKRSPNDLMLKATGHYKRLTIKKQYLKESNNHCTNSIILVDPPQEID